MLCGRVHWSIRQCSGYCQSGLALVNRPTDRDAAIFGLKRTCGASAAGVAPSLSSRGSSPRSISLRSPSRPIGRTKASEQRELSICINALRCTSAHAARWIAGTSPAMTLGTTDVSSCPSRRTSQVRFRTSSAMRCQSPEVPSHTRALHPLSLRSSTTSRARPRSLTPCRGGPRRWRSSLFRP